MAKSRFAGTKKYTRAIIKNSIKLIEKRIATALKNEHAIAQLLDEINLDSGIKPQTKTALINKLKNIEVCKLSEITSGLELICERFLPSGGEDKNAVVKIIIESEDAEEQL